VASCSLGRASMARQKLHSGREDNTSGRPSTASSWLRKESGLNRDISMRGKVLFVATVYTHLAAFHIPVMKLLQSRGYEVHAVASPAQGRKEKVEAAEVICHDVPFVR